MNNGKSFFFRTWNFVGVLGVAILFGAGNIIRAEDGKGEDLSIKAIAWLIGAGVVFVSIVGTLVHREAKRILDVIERVPSKDWFDEVKHLLKTVEPKRLRKHYRTSHFHGNWLTYLALVTARNDADLTILWEKVFSIARAPAPTFKMPEEDEEDDD